MTTPLKALLQERLRAKIVRQGDDEDAAVAHSVTPGAPPPVAKATPLVDLCEYSISPPVTTQARTRSYATGSARGRPRSEPPMAFDQDIEQFKNDRAYTHRSPRPLREEEIDSTSRRRYDPGSRQVRGGSSAHGIRLVSPAQTYSGNKRAWQEPRDERSFAHNDEPAYRRKRPARESRGDEQRVITRLPPPPPSPKVPRKNYDLSNAYQQYRELSNKRGYYSGIPTGAAQDADRERYEDTATNWPTDMTRPVEATRFGADYKHAPVRRGESQKPLAELRPRRWRSPVRAAGRATPTVDMRDADSLQYRTIESADDVVLPAEPQTNDRRDVYPVYHITPTYRQVSPGVVTARRRAVSPRRFSNHFLDPYHDFHNEHENKMVFHTVARAAPAPRSPCRRQFLRHEESEHTSASRFRELDERLSPESHQAAKDFVEKRQKRTSQGTPRTMATHRWLQSMVDARQSHQLTTAATEFCDSLQAPSLRCTPSEAEDSSETHNEGDDRDHDEIPGNREAAVPSRHPYYHYSNAACDPDHHHEHDYLRTLPPVYSPPRRLSGQSFFSSAV